jgi:hypothetical protein
MYFSQGVWEGITGLMATHPPLDERIRRIEPDWDGHYPPPLPSDVAAEAPGRGAAGLVGAELLRLRAVPVEVVEHAADQVASPTDIHRQYAAELVDAMPPEVVDAAHDPYGARALIYATLLDRDADVRAKQLRSLQQNADEAVFELALRLVKFVNQLDVRARLPLVDMTLPALRALSAGQYEEFQNCFVSLVRADERLGLFEWTLHQILLRHLRPQFEPSPRPQVHYYGLQRLAEPVSVLLSTLARASQADDDIAFAAGQQQLPEVPVRLLPVEACGLARLNAALQQLAGVAPQHRRRLVDACAAAICADRHVNVEEAELLRGICDLLDCPMPPLLPGQPLTPVSAQNDESG